MTTKQTCALETLDVMCRQEEHYQASDYLSLHASAASALHDDDNNNDDEPFMLDVDVESRAKMAAWCRRVVDACEFDRETVSIAMNILDRFVSCTQAKPILADRRLYQLAAMTSLYTAVKVHEPEAIDPAMVCTISHGTYTVQEVEDMEAQILMGVSWRVNPPTPNAFVRQYLELNDQLDDFAKDLVYNLAKVQTDLSVADYECMAIKPSVTAYCAVMNALTSLQIDSAASHKLMLDMTQIILLSLDQIGVQQVANLQNWLGSALLQQPVAQTILETCAKHHVVVKPTATNTTIINDVDMTLMDNNDKIMRNGSPRCIATTTAL